MTGDEAAAAQAMREKQRLDAHFGAHVYLSTDSATHAIKGLVLREGGLVLKPRAGRAGDVAQVERLLRGVAAPQGPACTNGTPRSHEPPPLPSPSPAPDTVTAPHGPQGTPYFDEKIIIPY